MRSSAWLVGRGGRGREGGKNWREVETVSEKGKKRVRERWEEERKEKGERERDH